MMYYVYAAKDIYSRPIESINPVDQILVSNYVLQASLMGFSLFLSFMIDKLHHYMRELRLLRKAMDSAKKQNRSFEDRGNGGTGEPKDLIEEVSYMREKIKELEHECESKDKELKSAETNSVALKRQSEEFLQKHARLQEENESIRNQMQSADQSSLHSGGKKNM